MASISAPTDAGPRGRHHGSIVRRSFPAVGAAVLVLTATTWIGKTIEQSGPSFERTHSFWGLFESARHGLEVPLAIGAALIVAFGAVSIFSSHESAAPAAITAWLAALTTGVVMLNTDNDYAPGAGAWLTLALTVVSGSIATFECFRGRER